MENVVLSHVRSAFIDVCSVALLCLLVISCTGSSAHQSAAQKKREAGLRALAYDWQSRTGLSDAEGKAVRDRICALPSEDARLLQRILGEKMEHTPKADKFRQALLEYAIAHDKCMLSLTPDDLAQVLSDMKGKPAVEDRP